MHSWVPFFGVFFVIFAGRSLLIHVLVFNRLRNFRLSAPSFRIISREETPPTTATVLGSLEAELGTLGFEFEHAVIYRPQEGETFEETGWVYVNRESRARGLVRKLDVKSGIAPRCSFESILDDGRSLVTSADFTCRNANEIQLENPVGEVPLADQCRAHLDFLRLMGANGQSKLLSLEAFESERKRVWEESMRLRTRLGQVYPAGEGKFAYTVKEAARRTIAALAKVRRLNRNKGIRAKVEKLEASTSTVASVEEEIQQYRRTTKQGEIAKLGSGTKLLMLVFSMGLFVLAFRLSLSWRTLLILIGVLTFHEGGHLLGMRIFGYKNLQMLYLPFLGAVAIGGKRESVKPWQELVVLFLGPLPGFVLGLLVATNSIFEHLPARHELGMILLGLNVFNLIPIHPLDGGQIVDILLFRRFPFGRVVFMGLSAAALLAAGTLGLFGTAFMVLGGALLLQMGKQMRQARIICSLKKELGSPLSRHDEETLLPAIFTCLRKQAVKLKTFARINFVRGVLTQCKSDPAGPMAFLFGVVAYTSPAWLAIILLAAQSFQTKANANAALANAQAEGLLDPIVEQTANHGVDATPFVLQIQELIKRKDADLKLEAIQRHVGETNPNWDELNKSIKDPDVDAVLVLARKVASADYIRENQGTISSLPKITRWLRLSAECAAANSDDSTAWSDLESAFRSVSLTTETSPSLQAVYLEASLPETLNTMETVLRQLNPSAEEIARLKDLLAAGRLAKPMLARRLASEIDVVKRLAKSEHDAEGRTGFLLKLVAPDLKRQQTRWLSDIKKLKERWQLANSDPNVSEEVVFAQSDIHPMRANELLLTRLRLAKAALAIEEYRLTHGKLPAALSEVVSLSEEQRNLITWDPQANRLRSEGSNKWNRQVDSPAVAAEEEDEDENSSATKHSSYTWNIRPSVTGSRSVTSAMR